MEIVDFNRGWHFSDAATGREEDVVLPHDAMINTKRVPGRHTYFLLAGFRGGDYVYRKTLELTPELDGKKLPPQPSLEAQTADLADDLTYYGHDTDDGLESGLITIEMLEKLAIWRLASSKAKAAGLKPGEERYASYTIRNLIDMMVGDAIRYSQKLIEQAAPETSEQARSLKHKLIAFSPDFEKLTLELRDFLYHNLYFHPELNKLNGSSLEKMTLLFNTFIQHPEYLGNTAKSRLQKDGLERTVADYIAGMTDVFAFREYDRFAYPNLMRRDYQKS